MKILFSMILFLVLASPAHADWTKKDTVYQLTYTVLHLIDWGQTLDIARNPDDFYEMNPILGEHPSVGRVNTYNIVSLITHTAISYYLPPKYRRWWQVSAIGVKVILVSHNNNIGVKVSF